MSLLDQLPNCQFIPGDMVYSKSNLNDLVNGTESVNKSRVKAVSVDENYIERIQTSGNSHYIEATEFVHAKDAQKYATSALLNRILDLQSYEFI